jgi:drug/metabolite transporter (DMT)-like permease
MICFAANSVITRYLVLSSRVSPFLVTMIRFVSGLGMLMIIGWTRPRTFRGGSLGASYLFGALFLGGYAFSISYGYLFIPVAAGTFVFYTFVVVTMAAYSIISREEKLTFRLCLGQLLGLLGVLVITFGRISSVTVLGVILMAATGVSWGLYSAYGRRFDVAFSYTYNSFLVLGVVLAFAAVAFAFSGQLTFVNISLQDLGLALYMGMVSTGLSYVLWNQALKKISASMGGLVQLVVPVLAPAMGVILLREQVTASLLLGGGLVLLGIYVVGRGRGR